MTYIYDEYEIRKIGKRFHVFGGFLQTGFCGDSVSTVWHKLTYLGYPTISDAEKRIKTDKLFCNDLIKKEHIRLDKEYERTHGVTVKKIER
jgi:hypothetical protein